MVEVKNTGRPTPKESNRGQLDTSSKAGVSNGLIGVDYLKINLRGTIGIDYKNHQDCAIGSFFFQSSERGTKNFEYHYTVFFEDRPFGEIECNPRKSFIDSDTVMLKLDNRILYSDTDLHTVINLFIEQTGLEFHNVTRLDIFADFVNLEGGRELRKFIQDFDNNIIASKGRVSEYSVYKQKIDGVWKFSGMSYGSRSSNRFIRIYDKTNELLTSGKDYISEAWKRANIEAEKVYRFEIEIKGDFLKRLENFAFADIFEHSKLVKLLECSLENYFDFYIEDGQARNDRKQKYVFLDFANLVNVANVAFEYVKARYKTAKCTIKSKMLLVRGLIREYVNDGQNGFYLKNALNVAYDYNIVDKFNERIDKYLEEFKKNRSWRYDYDHDKYVEQVEQFAIEYAHNTGFSYQFQPKF